MRTYPGTLPSKYAVLRVDYGAGEKHLYSSSEWRDDIAFLPDRDEADKAAQKLIEEDPLAIVAVMKIETLFGAHIKIQSVAKAG